jgi:hypothetical protein
VGQLDTPTTYLTSVPSRRGESGGPWIDIATGKVFAVARRVNAAPEGPSIESTPVTLIKPSLEAYFQTRGVQLPREAVATDFSLLSRTGRSSVLVTGDTGELASPKTLSGDLGQSITIKSDGGESSQCDSGSGRTVARASAQARITAFDLNGLRFEYAAAAQGGHYRTAVSCLGSLPVGLTGHDTNARAQISLNGEIEFEIGGTGVSIEWTGMPQTGATVRLITSQGQQLFLQPTAGSDRQGFRLSAPGRYRLFAEVAVRLDNRGGCCGASETGNATVTIRPIEGRIATP